MGGNSLMASAGRGLLLIKGNYNPAATYNIYDIVLHNGSTWIAKNSVTGVEPTTGENWQILAQGVDVEDLQNKIDKNTERINDISINAKDYGATGDGITDDYDFIVNAITHITANGGGHLLFPPGVYKIGSPINSVESNISFIGNNATLYMDFDTDHPLFLMSGDNISFIDLTFDSDPSFARLTSNSFIFTLGTDNITVEGCVFKNCPCAAVHLRDTKNGLITNNKISDSKADGIHVANASSDIILSQNILKNTGDDSLSAVWYTDGAAPPSRIKFDGNLIYNSQNKGINISNAVKIDITNNIINTTKEHGIGIYSWEKTEYAEDVVIQNNTIRNAGETSYGHSILVEDTTRCSIIDNICDYCTAQSVMIGNFSDLVIKGNTFSNSANRGMQIIDYKELITADNLIIDSNIVSESYGEAIFLAPSPNQALRLQNVIILNNIMKNVNTRNMSENCINITLTDTIALSGNFNHGIKTINVDSTCTGITTKSNYPDSVEEIINATFTSGTTGICIKNKETGFVKLNVNINDNIANGTTISTLPIGTRPTATQECKGFAKQASGIGRCSLTVNGAGVVDLSASDFNEPMTGTTFNLMWLS